MGDTRKSVTVWLSPRHKKMLEAMPGVQIADITRKAVEELFEARNDREYARICIEEDLEELAARWEGMLGVKTGVTITETQDGFRIVLIPLKRYSNA